MLTVQSNTGVVLAYLNNLESATIKESINGEFLLDFVALIDPLKTGFLYDNENLIEYKNDLFRVMILEELHSEDNMLTVAVTAVHISYDLIKTEFVDFNYTNTSAVNVMTQALLGTGFTLTNTDVTLTTSIQYTEECNAKQITIAIANNWQGELQYYRRDIQLLKQRGQQRGTEFRFGKNLRSIKRIRNFADNTVAYDINVEQGAEFGELGYYELGDTVKVIDEALNISIEVRIIEIEKDVMTGLNSKVVLGNELKDLRSSFSTLKKDVADTRQIIANSAPNWDKINAITDDLGNVIIGKLNTITQVTSAIVNATGTFEQRDNGLYWQDQPTKANSTFATFWGAQGITFANSKLPDGEWDWDEALGENGLIASRVTTPALEALTVEAVSVLAQKFIGQTIQGVNIAGSNITADNGDIQVRLNSTAGANPFEVYSWHQGALKRQLSVSNYVNGSSLNIEAGENNEFGNPVSYLRLGYASIAGGGVAASISSGRKSGGGNYDLHLSAPTVRVVGDLVVTGNIYGNIV